MQLEEFPATPAQTLAQQLSKSSYDLYFAKLGLDAEGHYNTLLCLIMQSSICGTVIHQFCNQMQIPFDKIAPEDFSTFMRILSLSKLLKDPINMRGKSRAKAYRGTKKGITGKRVRPSATNNGWSFCKIIYSPLSSGTQLFTKFFPSSVNSIR